jgi:hypothetical protein
MIQFWEAFDAKGRERSSKKQVAAEWKKLKPDEATFNAIMAGVVSWKRSDGWQRGYAPGAHRFLNLEKWKELPEPAAAPTTNGHRAPPPSTEDAFRVAREWAAKRQAQREGRETEPDDAIETNGVVR